MERRKSKVETRNSQEQTGSRSKGRVRDFKDLDVWKAAREFRREIYILAKGLPEWEKFGLANQLRRAGVSVTANIAEGFGRFGCQENVQFCRQARGSIYELRDHLTTCVDAGYFVLAEGRRLDGLAPRVAQLLNGYLRSTKNMKLAAENGQGRAA
ncbi:MAG: four helix bundle protein [Acidobacteriota bacterium]|nr:four helix bundle protein [Acidobacteriota bacterium]